MKLPKWKYWLVFGVLVYGWFYSPHKDKIFEKNKIDTQNTKVESASNVKTVHSISEAVDFFKKNKKSTPLDDFNKRISSMKVSDGVSDGSLGLFCGQTGVFTLEGMDMDTKIQYYKKYNVEIKISKNDQDEFGDAFKSAVSGMMVGERRSIIVPSSVRCIMHPGKNTCPRMSQFNAKLVNIIPRMEGVRTISISESLKSKKSFCGDSVTIEYSISGITTEKKHKKESVVIGGGNHASRNFDVFEYFAIIVPVNSTGSFEVSRKLLENNPRTDKLIQSVKGDWIKVKINVSN